MSEPLLNPGEAAELLGVDNAMWTKESSTPSHSLVASTAIDAKN